jgi:hypothetical protein
MVISRLTTKNRRPKQNIGNFSSCKIETSCRYKSLLQKDFMYLLEFDTLNKRELGSAIDGAIGDGEL